MPDGRPYLTMEVVRGHTLAAITGWVHGSTQEPGGADAGWTLRRLVQAFRQVCSAVAYAHQKGIVHRDLKPANIMLGQFGVALVMDWGLANLVRSHAADPHGHALSDEADPLATRRGAVVGTPPFMSPEQARGDLALMNERCAGGVDVGARKSGGS